MTPDEHIWWGKRLVVVNVALTIVNFLGFMHFCWR